MLVHLKRERLGSTVVYENTLSGPTVIDETSGETVQEDIGAEKGQNTSNTLTFTIE